MHQNDGGDAPIGVNEAERGADSVKSLGDADAAYHGFVNFGGNIVVEQASANRVTPAPIQGNAEQQNVAPVDQKRGAVVDVFGQECGRKRRERNRAQERNVDPGQIAIGAGEVVELSLLADPEDAVAKCGEAFDTLSGNTVVERMHRMESSTGGSTVLEPECKPR